MLVEFIEWDDSNLVHATGHGLTASEIEQAIWNADRAYRHRKDPDRRLIQSKTDGGRNVVVIVQLVAGGGMRPITGWEQ